MGMSASQARFLCLTARKNNVEFEGQQINQQRTTLSNESASYYSELCNMAVPVPPSIDDYTKVSYTFNDGAMTNTVTSLLYTGNDDDEYVVNYIQQWQDDYAIVPSSSSLVQVGSIGAGGGSGSPSIALGSSVLANTAISYASGEQLNASTSATYSIGGVTLRLLGVGPDGSTAPGGTIPSVDPPTESPTEPPTESPTDPPVTPPGKEYVDIDGDGTGDYEVFRESDGTPYYNTSAGGLSAYEESMIKYYSDGGAGGSLKLEAFVGKGNKIYYADDILQQHPAGSDFNESAYIIATEDESHNISLVGINSSGGHSKLDDDGNIIENEKHYIDDPSTIITVSTGSLSIALSYAAPAGLSDTEIGDTGEEPVEELGLVPIAGESENDTNLHYTSGSSLAAVSGSSDYWDSLTPEQQTQLLETENYYLALLRESLNTDSNFYVMYRKNSTTGAYEPYFYSEEDLKHATPTDRKLISVPAYSVGSEVKTKEVLNQKCTVEQDSSGRYVAIKVKFDSGEEKTYQLNTNTTTDEEAYNDAMNDYYYQQHEYDHKIQEINAKLEIIQQQDKQLELKLKQLDTEENAISTEMDAVKKVISKNIDNSFKTFSA